MIVPAGATTSRWMACAGMPLLVPFLYDLAETSIQRHS